MRKRTTPSEGKLRQLRADRQVHPSGVATVSPHDSASDTTPKSASWSWLSLVKYVVLAVIAVPFINYAALLRESRELRPPGELYDIGHGQKLFLNCTGKGLPTVILDAPTGMTSDIWGVLQPLIAKFTRVCVYDRAGLGFSDRPPYVNRSLETPQNKLSHQRWKEFTVERMADDLYRLLSYSSSQPKPLILVGSGIGALVARFYTQIYEGDVANLVLIDPLVEDLFTHDEDDLWLDFWFNHLGPSFALKQLGAALGLTRVALLFGLVQSPLDAHNLSDVIDQRQKHLMCNPRHLSSVVDEHHFINDSFSQIRTVLRIKPFPRNVPVLVMTSEHYDKRLSPLLNKAWSRSQRHLVAHLHTNSRHVVIDTEDHRTTHRQTAAILKPIRNLVNKWHRKSAKSETS